MQPLVTGRQLVDQHAAGDHQPLLGKLPVVERQHQRFGRARKKFEPRDVRGRIDLARHHGRPGFHFHIAWHGQTQPRCGRRRQPAGKRLQRGGTLQRRGHVERQRVAATTLDEYHDLAGTGVAERRALPAHRRGAERHPRHFQRHRLPVVRRRLDRQHARHACATFEKRARVVRRHDRRACRGVRRRRASRRGRSRCSLALPRIGLTCFHQQLFEFPAFQKDPLRGAFEQRVEFTKRHEQLAHHDRRRRIRGWIRGRNGGLLNSLLSSWLSGLLNRRLCVCLIRRQHEKEDHERAGRTDRVQRANRDRLACRHLLYRGFNRCHGRKRCRGCDR